MDYTYDHYYDFSKIPNFREMNEVFAGIFDRSVKYYIRNRDGYDQTFALRKIVEFVRDLEKSLIGLINLGYVTTSNIELIKREYKSLDTIGLLESSFRGGIYGISYSKRIEINPNLSGSRTLSNSERTLLYVCHEMGHRFHEGWKEPKYINNDLLRDKDVQEQHQKLSSQDRLHIYQGSRLLDEALTQDRAEEVAYYFAGKRRPELSLRRSRVFNGEPFRTNFDYYGELQEPAIKFGKTLKYISKSDKEVLKQLGRAALDDRFMAKIISEYQSRDGLVDLYALIHSMGVIKDASYEAFGMGNIKGSLAKSKNALTLINRLTANLPSNATRINQTPPPLPKRFRKI